MQSFVSKPHKRKILKIIIQEAWAVDLVMADILGPRRDAKTNLARIRAIIRARLELKLSFPQLATVFQRDHSTIVHAFNAHYSKLKEEIQNGCGRHNVSESNNGKIRRRSYTHAFHRNEFRKTRYDSAGDCIS